MKTHRMALFVSARQGSRERDRRETRQMLALAAGLTRLGHEVDLVVQQADEQVMAALAHGVRLVELGAQHRLSSILALTRYLARHRPCVLLASGLDANLMALKAGRLNRDRVPVVIYHATLISSEWHALGDKANGLRRKMALKYPQAALALSASDEITREILREGGVSRTRVALVNLALASSASPAVHGSQMQESSAELKDLQLMQCLGLLLKAAGVISSAKTTDAGALNVGSLEVSAQGGSVLNVSALDNSRQVVSPSAVPSSISVESPRAVMANSSERD